MSNVFQEVRTVKQNHSTFDLSHQKKMTLKPGLLIPTLVLDVIPGDRIRLSDTKMVRLQPMVAPVMHEVSVTTHYFFVPYRILSDNWEDFIRGGKSGTEQIPIPYLSASPSDFDKVAGDLNKLIAPSSLWDYFGLPACTDEIWQQITTPVDPTASLQKFPPINLLPMMAYHKIWNEYYRYQSVQEEFDMDFINEGQNDLTTNKPQWNTFFNLRRRRWSHDYFTSMLPSPQRGQPVTIPVYGNAPIKFNPANQSAEYETLMRNSKGEIHEISTELHLSTTGSPPYIKYDGTADPDFPGSVLNPDISGTHYVDLAQTVATTIADLRKAYVLQEWLEMTNNAGTRYFEYIKSMYDVNVKDDRLQRPEFIGGNNLPIIISEVVQTSETKPDSPLASMGGHGIAVGSTPGQFGKFVEEFGVILGLTSIRPKPGYQNQIPKMFTKLDNMDYFLKFWEHIGEQAVDNQELNYNWKDTAGNNIKPAGYQSRFVEYKYVPDTVHGDIIDSLSYWAWNRKFDPFTTVPFNGEFIECNPDYDIFQLTDTNEDPFIMQLVNQISARRNMTYFSSPHLA